ncbi:MAG: 50S ribosomal protein L10 [Candidatus Cloacimonetes bacterium]|nr:50S ribosomal protein L10 [Candidatus Cloacimonadota bacterium]
MLQQYKIDEVNQLKTRMTNAKSIVLVDYKGINIEEVDELRNRMRDANVDYFVSKNTFIKIALNELGINGLDKYLIGSTAVAVSLEDEVSPAREFAKFKKEVVSDKDFPSFKYGYVSGNVIDSDQLQKLSQLPGKDALIAMTLQMMNAPISGFVGALSGIIRKFVYVVDEIANQKKEN